MCRRSQEPAIGQWVLPGGFLECGETLEEGAIRETFEETGVIVDPARLDLWGIINVTAVDQIIVAFRVELLALPTLRPGAECIDAAFLSEHEIPEGGFAWRKLLGSVPGRFFNELRSGDFSITLITLGPSPGAGLSVRDYKVQRS
jgi:ADP-ribose pyrophosphatase YjhB (NUDIX family)